MELVAMKQPQLHNAGFAAQHLEELEALQLIKLAEKLVAVATAALLYKRQRHLLQVGAYLTVACTVAVHSHTWACVGSHCAQELSPYPTSSILLYPTVLTPWHVTANADSAHQLYQHVHCMTLWLIGVQAYGCVRTLHVYLCQLQPKPPRRHRPKQQQQQQQLCQWPCLCSGQCTHAQQQPQQQ